MEKPKDRGGLRWAGRMRGSGLYQAKRGCNEIMSSVTTRTNLLSSLSPFHEEGGMVSDD